MHTVFFLARSPEAPSTTMTVLSLSSTGLGNSQHPSRTCFGRTIHSTVAACCARKLWSLLLLLPLLLLLLLLPPPEMRRMQQRSRAELSQSPKQGSSTEIVCHEWRGVRRLTLQRNAYRRPSCWAGCAPETARNR